MPRFDVLAALERAPRGLTMSALSEQLLVSNGNVTGIVERLVQDGLVVRTSDASDRRTTFVRMTPKGEQSFATMAQAHEGWVNELLGGLAPADFDALDGLLQRASPSHRKTET
jgi:DNA-binding MarR family transcriptional regulator